MKLYTIKRTVIEIYQVKATSQEEALSNMEDPYSVIVKSDHIIKTENQQTNSTDEDIH